MKPPISKLEVISLGFPMWVAFAKLCDGSTVELVIILPFLPVKGIPILFPYLPINEMTLFQV